MGVFFVPLIPVGIGSFLLKLACESFPRRTGNSPQAGISGQIPELCVKIEQLRNPRLLQLSLSFFLLPKEETEQKKN